MRAIRWTTAIAVAAALALPAAAPAGGFATVGLSSLPDGTAPGRPWHVTLTILQHGRTPMAGLHPTVLVRRADGAGAARTFRARPAGRPGVYTVEVVFPAAGTWRYAIDDGFTQTHTFAPVAIGASRAVPAPAAAPAAPAGAPAARADGASDGSGGDVAAALGAAAAAGLLAGVLTALALRRRRGDVPGTAPAR